MQISRKDAVVKMSHYINYLAAKVNGGQEAIHVKQAKVNNLVKLSANLARSQDLLVALRQTYPQMSEATRFKTANSLVKCLAAKMQKAASQKQALNYGRMASQGLAAAKATGITPGSPGKMMTQGLSAAFGPRKPAAATAKSPGLSTQPALRPAPAKPAPPVSRLGDLSGGIDEPGRANPIAVR